jgi:nicotinamide-nucleotide amidase
MEPLNLASLAARVGTVLRARGLMLAVAESCTGGWIAQAITSVSGSSEWFERGFVTYSNVAKEEMLGVRGETLREHGAVSERTVREMAAGALRFSRAQVSLAVSGVAGPTGGTPDKPVGTVWLAWAIEHGATSARGMLFEGDRQAVRGQAVLAALQGVVDILGR